MTAIPDEQNTEPMLRLLRASQQTYLRATRLLVVQWFLAVVAPALGAALALAFTPAQPYVAAAALLIAFFDVAVLDRVQSRKIRLAAKISEAFDCGVLDLPANRFVAGGPVDHEVITEAAAAWSGRPLTDWYPPSIGKAPPHLGRIICQRTNFWYDATLRRHYGVQVLSLAALVVIALLIAAIAAGQSVETMVVAVLAPVAPMLIWSVREYLRQQDTADEQEASKADVEALWTTARAGACGEADCLTQSREFQDALYMRRATSPLMLPVVYSVRRPKMEKLMNKGAEELLKEIGIEP